MRRWSPHLSVRLGIHEAIATLLLLAVFYSVTLAKISNWSILIINLSRRIDRKQTCSSKFKDHPHQFIVAVDGNELAETRSLNETTMLPGEVGCFLSHIKAIKRIAAKKLDYALIVEDDVIFSDGFSPSHVPDIVLNAPSGWLAIALGNNLTPMQSQYKSYSLEILQHDLYGAYAILYSLHGAQEILRHFQGTVEESFDIWLGRSIPMYFISPSIAFVEDVEDSDTIVSVKEEPHKFITCEEFITQRLLPWPETPSEIVSSQLKGISFMLLPGSLPKSARELLNNLDNRLGDSSSLSDIALKVVCFDRDPGMSWERMLKLASFSAMSRRYSMDYRLKFSGSSRDFGVYIAFYTV